jgi:hypothetical protein
MKVTGKKLSVTKFVILSLTASHPFILLDYIFTHCGSTTLELGFLLRGFAWRRPCPDNILLAASAQFHIAESEERS